MILEAASGSGTVLATAENYRRDGPNRLARAVLEQGMLGEVHLMIEANVGGDDAVVISPWRHIRESGSIALDMGVHYTDIFSYYHGELEQVFGSAFVAEPLRALSGRDAGDRRRRGSLAGRHSSDGRGFPRRPVRDGVRRADPAVLFAVRAGAPLGPAQRARSSRFDDRPAGSLRRRRSGPARGSNAQRCRTQEGARRLRARRSGRLVLRLRRGLSTNCRSPRSTRRRSASSSTTSPTPSSTGGRQRSTDSPAFAPSLACGRSPSRGRVALRSASPRLRTARSQPHSNRSTSRSASSTDTTGARHERRNRPRFSRRPSSSARWSSKTWTKQ